MFPGPDQCQQDAGTLEDGKHARDQSLDLFSWSTPRTTLPSSSLPSQRHCTPCPADPHHPMQTGLHTCHIPPPKNTHHTHLPLTHHPNTYQHTPQWQHTHVPCVHGYTNTQRHTQMHVVTPNPNADNHSSHILSGRGRAAGMQKKLQVLKCII